MSTYNVHSFIRTVMFNHMEIPLHYSYGSLDYWNARRSMRYNLKLYAIATGFRKKYLNSNDIDDKTKKPEDWTLEKVCCIECNYKIFFLIL